MRYYSAATSGTGWSPMPWRVRYWGAVVKRVGPAAAQKMAQSPDDMAALSQALDGQTVPTSWTT